MGRRDLVVTSDPERTKEFASSSPTITIGPSGVSVSSERYTVVLTEYARELSWLIERLCDSLQDYITEFISKYEFYAILGQAAKYLANTPRQAQNAKDLLLAVLSQAEDLLHSLRSSFS